MTTPQTPGRTLPPFLEKEGGPSAGKSSDLKVGPPGYHKPVFPWDLWSECVSSLR